MSDRIGVMSEGKLLQVDSPQDLYDHPRTRFVADFIGEINLLPAKVIDPTMVELAGAYKIRARTDLPSGEEITIGIRPERLTLHTIEDGAPADRNSVEGTVFRRIYHGDFFFYDIQTTAGILEVKEENRPSIATHDEGERVVASWHPEATTVVGA